MKCIERSPGLLLIYEPEESSSKPYIIYQMVVNSKGVGYYKRKKYTYKKRAISYFTKLSKELEEQAFSNIKVY